MIRDGFLLIGKIIDYYGLCGELKVYSFLNSRIFYKSFKDLNIEFSNNSKMIKVRMSSVKMYKKKFLLLHFKNINNREDGKCFIGSKIYISKSVLPPLGDNTYFWSDLIGLEVKSINGKNIGYLESIIDTGANDVYVIKKGNHEFLIPAIKSVVISVDLKSRVIIVRLPRGLK